MMTQLTVTGPLREQDAVRAGERSAAGTAGDVGRVGRRRARKVAKATQVPYAMAFDRSGHRFAGAAISMGAKVLRCQGQPGRRRRLQGDGEEALRLEPRRHDAEGGLGRRRRLDRTATRSRSSPTAASCMYLSGSWQIRRMDTQIGKNFDWIAVPNPCGPAACTGIPGGAAFVALEAHQESRRTSAASSTSSRARPSTPSTWRSTENIPAQRRRSRRRASTTTISPPAKAALDVFVARGAEALAGRLRDPGLQAQPRDLQSDRRTARAGDRRRDVPRRRAQANRRRHRRAGEGRRRSTPGESRGAPAQRQAVASRLPSAARAAGDVGGTALGRARGADARAAALARRAAHRLGVRRAQPR